MRYGVTSTSVFDKWLRKLRDRNAVLAIANRITRAAAGNLGDARLAAKNSHPIFLVIYPSFGVAARLAYAYMRPLLRLESGINPGVILDDYFLSQALDRSARA